MKRQSNRPAPRGDAQATKQTEADAQSAKRQRVALWIRSELDWSGKSQAELAQYLWMQESQVTRLLQGKRGLDIGELERIEDFFGGTSLKHIPLKGLLGENVWRDQPPSGLRPVHADCESHVPIEIQAAYRLAGDSIDGEFRERDLVFVMPVENRAGDGRARVGDIVVVKRQRGPDLFQLSLSLVELNKNQRVHRPLFEHSASADSESVVGVVFSVLRRMGTTAMWTNENAGHDF